MNKQTNLGIETEGGEVKVKNLWRRVTGGVMTMIAVLTFAALNTSCGKTTSHSATTSEPGISLRAWGPRGNSVDGTENILLRANGRDVLEVEATVRGLSTLVGFFLTATNQAPSDGAASNWGTWIGGVTADGSDASSAAGVTARDGFQYYTADRNGKARASFVTNKVTTADTFSGRQQLIARSLDQEVRLMITFDMASLTIFPLAINVANQGARVTVEVRGGLPPIEWWLDDPLNLAFHVRDATSIYLFSLTGKTGIATLFARDAEGQMALAVVTVVDNNTNCYDGVLTVGPTTGTLPLAVTLDLTDPDRAGDASATVAVAGTGLTSPGTVTLLPISAGSSAFTASYTLTCGGCGTGKVFTFTYIDPDASTATPACTGLSVSTIFTTN